MAHMIVAAYTSLHGYIYQQWHGILVVILLIRIIAVVDSSLITCSNTVRALLEME